MSEIFDLVNEKDEVIGQASREECHTDKSLFHRGVFIIVLNNKNEILIQKRSKDKDLYPSLLDFSVGEHLKSGENYEQAARRGLKEELNIEAEKLTYVGKILFRQRDETEFDAIYFTKSNKEIDEIEFQKEEIESLKFMTIDQIREILKNNEELFVPKIKEVFDEFLKVYEK